MFLASRWHDCTNRTLVNNPADYVRFTLIFVGYTRSDYRQEGKRRFCDYRRKETYDEMLRGRYDSGAWLCTAVVLTGGAHISKSDQS